MLDTFRNRPFKIVRERRTMLCHKEDGYGRHPPLSPFGLALSLIYSLVHLPSASKISYSPDSTFTI